jgi:hypothetical protein
MVLAIKKMGLIGVDNLVGKLKINVTNSENKFRSPLNLRFAHCFQQCGRLLREFFYTFIG